MWKFFAPVLLGMSVIGLSMPLNDKSTPLINNIPKHYFLLRVCKSYNIHKPVTLMFDVDYFTTTHRKECVIVTNKLEGASAPKTKTFFHQFILSSHKKCREFKIPLDYLTPGYCGWRASNIGFRFLPYGKELEYDGDAMIEPFGKCVQHAESTYYVTKDNKILDVVNIPRYWDLAANCHLQTYQINIRIK